MFKNVQFLSNRVSFDGTFTTNGEGGAVVIFNQNEEVLTKLFLIIATLRIMESQATQIRLLQMVA